jgi:tetratricopeptide (TPR) repeat protein
VILVVGVLRFALAIGDTDDRRPPTFPQTYTDYLATTEAMNRVLLGTPAYRNYEDLMATLEAGSSGIAISDSLQATLDEAYQGFDNVPFAMTITPEIPEVSSVVAEDALRQGDDFFARGQYALAVSQYDIVLRGNPSADVYYKRGMAYELQMRDPFDDLALKAMTDYSLAAQLDPAYAEAYLSMGQLYLTRWQLQGREFDHDRALEHLNHYVELVGAAVDPAIQELLDALNETP